MAVTLEVIEDGSVAVLEVPTPETVLVEVNDIIAEAVEVVTSVDPVTVEVLAGIPGAPNVVISDTRPTNPYEGLIWIDIS